MATAGIDSRSIFDGGGEMGALMRSIDWTNTPLGNPAGWPQSLKTSVSILLSQRTPVFIFWGPEYVQFYNDAYRPILGTTKHPAAVGQRGRDCWPEIWDIIEPMLAAVHRGESTAVEDGLLLINRTGYLEEGYYNYTYSPIRDESGAVGGVFCVVYDTTARVIGERRLRTLRDLAMRSSTAKTPEAACRAAAETLAANPHDVPFASLYLYEEDRTEATLVATAGIPAGHPVSPVRLRFTGDRLVLAEAAENPESPVIENLAALGPLPKGAWNTEPGTAIVLPISVPGQSHPVGLIVAGLNPHKKLDASYRTFFDLLAGQIGNAVAEARAYEEERRRAEALAELDRAKTTFFSNVSHEFRTPLTLMLGPLQEALAKPEAAAVPRDEIELIHRNSLRLLKLVNTLLDFARIEAGRMEAFYVPTDLASLTADLASSFRSAVEKAGLRLSIDCPPLPVPVYVDREMWEKIVLNLLSNAFKFTFEGEISVSVRQDGDHVELAVRDTGIGIREADLPRLFERFHRVEGAQGRTLEGSGIGLAFIQELVKLHGGSVGVESQYGKGSIFTVKLPLGSAHLPAGRLGTPHPHAAATSTATAYIEEALRWLPDRARPTAELVDPIPLPDTGVFSAPPQVAGPRARLLVADDNADMRDYLRRLLSGPYDVDAVSDGAAALAAIRKEPPDLVLADGMMPGLDGFELIQAIRGDPRIATLPVMVLSARAGEEARIDGLRAGADDYLVKPFSARELLARVSSRLEIARLRSEAAQKEKELRLAAEAQRQRFYGMLNDAPAAIAVLRGPEHVFEIVNSDYLRAVGRTSRESLVGKPIREALPEIRGQIYPDLLDQVYRTGESRFGRESHAKLDRRGDGKLEDRFFNFVYQPSRDAQGRVEGVFVHAVDVTDQVLARRRIEESETRFRQLADSMPQIVWAADSRGVFDYFNHRWREFVGVVWANGREPRWEDVLHADDQAAWSQCWSDAVRFLRQFQMECRLFDRASGSYRCHLARAVPSFENGTVRWYGTCTDIEEQKRSEEIIRQKQRLESTGLLAGGVAHDFNNLLTGVLGNASLLLDDGSIPRQALPLLRDIVDAAERASDLTRQMLAYAGKGMFSFEPLDLSEQVRGMSQLLLAAVPKKVRLDLGLTGDLPLIHADVRQVHQVVMNLVVNAAEAIGTDRAGLVTLTTSGEVIDARPTGNFAPEPPAPGQYVVLTVQDDGPGMAPDVLAKIFDPFFTTKFMGRGLGLSAVLGIVRSHEGAMRVESAPGEGTVFRVYFPAAERDRARDGHDSGLSALRPTILIIDDEEIVRKTARKALETHGYSVSEAANGREGVEIFQADPGRYRLILLDWTMPVMDGEESLRCLRGISPNIPIVLSSGYDEREATNRIPQALFSGFIHKPYSASKLVTLVENVLNRTDQARTGKAGW